MIPPESKAKLEAMADKFAKRTYPRALLAQEYCRREFMQGAQAAWQMATELAVKAERERCAQVVFDTKPGATNRDVMKAILNPHKDEADK